MVRARAFGALVAVFALAVAAGAFAGPTQDAFEAYGTVKGQFNTPERLNRNLLAPIASDTMAIQGNPADNTSAAKAATGTLACPASDNMFIISADFDANLDITVTVDQALPPTFASRYAFSDSGISGVAGNGYVKCDAGTWTNCRYYKWTTDVSARVISQMVPMSELGGMFCSNISCTGVFDPAWRRRIVDTLSTGVVSAFSAVGNVYALSVVSADDARATYAGKDLKACPGATAAATGDVEPTTDYTKLMNPTQGNRGLSTQIINDGQSMVSGDMARTDSTTYLTLMSGGGDTSVERLSCSMTHTLAMRFQDFMCTGSLPPGAVSATDSFLYFRVTSPQVLETQFSNCDLANVVYTTPPSPGPPAPQVIYTPTTGLPHLYTDVALSALPPGSEADGIYVYFDSLLMNRQARMPPGADRCTHVVQDLYKQCVRHVVMVDETVNEGACATIDRDACKLRNEDVDGVRTVDAYTPRGSAPASTCRQFPTVVAVTAPVSYTTTYGCQVSIATGADTFQACCPWWSKTQEWVCDRSAPFNDNDFTDMMGRYKQVRDSTEWDTGMMSYADVVGGDNAATYNNPLDNVACHLGCKVRRMQLVLNTDRFSDTTNRGQLANSDSRYLEETGNLLCVMQTYGGDWMCPLEPDQEIVRKDPGDPDCTCISDFETAVSASKVIEEASKDMMCAQN